MAVFAGCQNSKEPPQKVKPRTDHDDEGDRVQVVDEIVRHVALHGTSLDSQVGGHLDKSLDQPLVPEKMHSPYLIVAEPKERDEGKYRACLEASSNFVHPFCKIHLSADRLHRSGSRHTVIERHPLGGLARFSHDGRGLDLLPELIALDVGDGATGALSGFAHSKAQETERVGDNGTRWCSTSVTLASPDHDQRRETQDHGGAGKRR